MFCPKCGKQIDDGSKFCPFCGADISNDNISPERKRNENIQREQDGNYAYNGKKPMKTSVIVIICIAAVAAVVAILMALGLVKFSININNPNEQATSSIAGSDSSIAGSSVDIGTPTPLPSEQPEATETPAPTQTAEPTPETIIPAEYTSEDFKDISMAAAYLLRAKETSSLGRDIEFENDEFGVEDLAYFLSGYTYGAGGIPEQTGINEGKISENGMEVVWPKSSVETFLRSVFGYYLPDTDIQTDYIYYSGNSLHRVLADGAPVYDFRFCKAETDGNEVVVTGEYMEWGNAGADTKGIYEITLEYDPDSLFSYHIESIEPADDPAEEFTKAEASSVLAPQGENVYDADMVLDRDPSTAWVEGVDGLGEGEYIILSADSPQKVHGIRILEGYMKSQEVYQQNAVPYKFRLEFSDGTVIETQPQSDLFRSGTEGVIVTKRYNNGSWAGHTIEEIKSAYAEDFISLGTEIETTYIKITILAAEAGPEKEFEDTAISEIIPY
jgi:hypothetical protein